MSAYVSRPVRDELARSSRIIGKLCGDGVIFGGELIGLASRVRRDARGAVCFDLVDMNGTKWQGRAKNDEATLKRRTVAARQVTAFAFAPAYA